MKISARAKDEFEFYLHTDLDMIGHTREVTHSADGQSALECWWLRDTHGKNAPCREPEVLAKAIRGKESINLQVKLWAEDIADGMLLRQRELLEYTRGWPEWIFRAVMNQAAKITMNTVGFVPRFARAEYLFGNVWPPELDRFDAAI